MNKRGQVWVETVIYTLIAFVLIGAVLAFVKPKIEEFQDKAIIEQTLSAAENINTVMLSTVQGGSGNRRIIEMGIQKGTLEVDGETDKLVFLMESRYAYSQPGSDISVGNVIVRTEEQGKLNLIKITMNYSDKYDITYQDEDASKLITKSSTPYKIAISNNGKQNGLTVVDFEVI